MDALTGSQVAYMVGIIGCVIGIAGGVFGTYCSISNAKGPQERRFIVKAATVIWIASVAFVFLIVTLPNSIKLVLWLPYGIFMPLLIILMNNRLKEIQASEPSDTENFTMNTPGI